MDRTYRGIEMLFPSHLIVTGHEAKYKVHEKINLLEKSNQTKQNGGSSAKRQQL